jgi:hypothetical protein
MHQTHASLVYAAFSILEALKRLKVTPVEYALHSTWQVCRKSALSAFLTILGNLALLALLYKWLTPKYCSTMYRNLEIALLRSFSYSVSSVPAVALPLRMMPSSMLFMDKNSRFGFPKYPYIRKYLLDVFFRMTTPRDTQRKIRAVMMGSRCHFRGENKSMFDIILLFSAD